VCVPCRTSGARYSGVPQKVLVVVSWPMPSLHRPKSVILTWPDASSRMFSSFMSLGYGVAPLGPRQRPRASGTAPHPSQPHR
jgi:hypothetical protein